jgi:hypothetical protein
MSENVQTFSGKVNVADNLLVGTSHFFVDRQNNRVGIGTSTPDASSMLDVTGNIKSGGTITATGGFSGDGSGLSGVNSDSGSWVNGSSSNIHLAVSGDNVGIGIDNPGHKLDVDGDINISSGSTLRVGGTPAVFSNWSVNGSDIYRSSGNVGIGVTSPQTNLHVESSGSTGVDIYGGNTGHPYIFIGEHQSTYSSKWGGKLTYYGDSNVRWLNISVVDDNVETAAITVRRNGHVGVGTESPDSILHVQSDVQTVTGGPIKKTAATAATSHYNYILNGPRPGTTTDGAVHFINGSGRSTDGGTSTYTIRNNSGQLRLGSSSHTTLFNGNHLRMAENDNSFFHFGPNGTWSGELYVGATSDRTNSSALKSQVITTNGNLHLDAGNTRDIYMNYYRGAAVRVKNILRMEGCVTEWTTYGNLLTHRYVTNTYAWGRWNGPHHFDLYSNTNFTMYNGGVNSVPFYINFYSHAPIKTSNYTTISSDDRIKINEKYIENATQTLLKLKPQNYDKLACLEKDRVEGEEVWFKKESGLITQDVYYDAPELRHLVGLPQDAEVPDEKPYVDNDPQKDPDYSMWGSEPAGLQYQGFIPYLIKSNQEIYQELQTTQTELADAKTDLEEKTYQIISLEARLAALEQKFISN